MISCNSAFESGDSYHLYQRPFIGNWHAVAYAKCRNVHIALDIIGLAFLNRENDARDSALKGKHILQVFVGNTERELHDILAHRYKSQAPWVEFSEAMRRQREEIR